MGTPHKHAELIKAWADGAEIQLKCAVGWIDTHNPNWDGNWDGPEYRIKPKTIKYRIGVFIGTNGDFSPFIATNEFTHNYYEKLQHFAKWLGDWQEIEV